MCTTFLCYSLVKSLLSDTGSKTELLDYPNLIRLNPNIPWKTRGNAALALRIRSSLSSSKLFQICKSFVAKFATSSKANSGLVILEGEKVPESIRDFSRRALFSVLGLREARTLVDIFDLYSFSLRSQQGLVGALASIGNVLAADHTYELIAYRRDLSLPRVIEKSRIRQMNQATFPSTFSSYDAVYGRIMIAPHGPDPVLCGIRGETAQDVKRAFEMLLPLQNLRGWMVFRSNQGTGEHLCENIALKDPKAYSSGKLVGTITSFPKAERGGHVFFSIRNEEGEIPCACYEPTAELRKYAMSLIPGDIVEVGGGVRKPTALHPKILNVEYFKPVRLETKIKTSNQKCPSCEISMSSRGRGKGYKCPRCGYFSTSAKKNFIAEHRSLELRMYIPPVKAHRHLTKPEHRFLTTAVGKSIPVGLIEGWMN